MGCIGLFEVLSIFSPFALWRLVKFQGIHVSYITEPIGCYKMVRQNIKRVGEDMG